VVATEAEGMELISRLLSFLPASNDQNPPDYLCEDPVDRQDAALRQIVPDNPSRPYGVRDIIVRVVDQGDFLEVHRDFAENIVVGFARLKGSTVGLVANQPKVLAGCLDVNASCKAARFVRFCDAFNIPLVTLVDCPGYLPGVNQEYNGIIRHGAKLLYAYSEATVPKITVVLRKDYGGAYSAMCGKALRADIVAALPTAEIAVMGPDGAANIIFRDEIKSAADPAAKRQEMVREYRAQFANPYKAAEWGLVNDIIDPAALRPSLIRYLAATAGKRETRPPKKHCNLPL
jgi:acetyl-CoA carboxylase carboxyltransferase component